MAAPNSIEAAQAIFSSPMPQSMGEGDRPGNTGWGRGRASSSLPAARPLHHSPFGERSPSPVVFATGAEKNAIRTFRERA
jgi:hypothetical protein